MSRIPIALAAMVELANEVGRAENVPPALILAVAKHESGGFYPDAARGEPHLGDSSHGLMQLLLSTARGEGYSLASPGGWNPLSKTGTGLYNPKTNLTLGAKHLRRLYMATGDLEATLSAYNAGLGNAKRATTTTRFCEVWKPDAPKVGRSIDKHCARIRVVRPGEFPNQPYVDRVMGYLREFGGSPTMPFSYAVGSGGEARPAGTSVSGSSPSPSPTFIIRAVPAVLLAAVGMILWLMRGGR
jgi:hypothetical protein